ncbi:MAG: PhnD/SsuA/transferrin family substrate-binding protein, partial [Methyloprofundus sp.]|nr:PhnD/SsuA/transferrin family substrate-binding protein [Methyloprofundus sp.]
QNSHFIEKYLPNLEGFHASYREMLLFNLISLRFHRFSRFPEVVVANTSILVAKKLLQGDADVGIFLAEAYDDLSKMIKMQLRVLVRSEISDIHHSLMIGPKLLDKRDEIQKALLEMASCEKGKGVLESLGFDGWEKVEVEEVEFMIDLLDALSM